MGRPARGADPQSGDGGQTLTYAKPASYAVWIAPFLRLSPTRGAAIANALLLALATVVAARTLERRIGPAAPLWVAAWIFASVAFSYVFWAHSDLFLMSLSALALALTYGADPDEPRRRALLRWLAVGALLYLVTASRPFYGVLLIPAALAVPRPQRKLGLSALVLACVLLLAVSSFSNLAEGDDSWTPYGGERQSFDSSTGFPEVELPAGSASWKEQIAARGSRTWRAADEFDIRQSSWNAVYSLVGRHVGLLPYFLPLLLGIAGFRKGEGRGMLIVAAAIGIACFLLTRPFNFYGGGGAIANRYFLPLYPALWFAAGRPARAASWGGAVLAAALAAPFLWPLWAHPRAYFLDEHAGYRYVSDFARRVLPYETTQSHLKPSGQEDFVHGTLWVKPLTTNVRPEGDGSQLIRITGGDHAQILLGSPAPIGGVRMLRNGTVRVFRFPRPRAVHRMWWTRDPVYLYQIELDPAGGKGFTFQLQAITRTVT